MRNVLVLVMGILVAIGCGKKGAEPNGSAAVVADSENPFQAVSPKTESKAKPATDITKSASPAPSTEADNPFAAVKPKEGESVSPKPVKPSAAGPSSPDPTNPFKAVSPKAASQSTSAPAKLSTESPSTPGSKESASPFESVGSKAGPSTSTPSKSSGESPNPSSSKDSGSPFEAMGSKSEPSSASTPVTFSDKPESAKPGTKPNAKPLFSDDDQPKQEGGSDSKAKRPQSPPPILGKWSWPGPDGDVTVFKDGTYQRANGGRGTWTVVDEAARQYKMAWSSGKHTNLATVSPDGKTLRITNMQGQHPSTCKRRD